MSEKILGADAAAVESAGSIERDQLSHAAPTFTPGPWMVANIADSDDRLIFAGDPDAGLVYEKYPARITGVARLFGTSRVEADTNLIAAAPELYEALRFHAEQVYAILSSDGYADIPSRIIAAQEHVTAWRAALAKAEGR